MMNWDSSQNTIAATKCDDDDDEGVEIIICGTAAGHLDIPSSSSLVDLRYQILLSDLG